MHIVVDLMGGDTSPILLYQGALEASYILQGKCEITVLGTKDVIEQAKKEQEKGINIRFLEVEEEILMTDSPLLAARRKANSSMAIGIKELKKNPSQAFISSGNTGALTAFSNLEFLKLPFIDRPALLTLLPTKTSPVAVLDVGANVTFRPKHFLQYALMGAAYVKSLLGVKKPKIGLLNVGEEARKGTKKLRLAHDYFEEHFKKLKPLGLDFVGNIESRDIFHGSVDVIVTDGFTGNVFLKTCEGVSSFIIDQVQERLIDNANVDHSKLIDNIEKYLNYQDYPGALMIGVDQLVIKCHGYSSTKAMLNAILGAYQLLEKDILNKVKAQLEQFEAALQPEK